MQKNKLKVGSLVKALCGREYAELFVISKIENGFAYLTNGKSRTIQNTKKKNLKHLYCLLVDTPLCEKFIENKITNADIIKFIKDFTIEK